MASENQGSATQNPDTGLTARAAHFAVDRTIRFPAEALSIAKLSIFDWMAVTIAAIDEPVSKVVRSYVARDGGAPVATVVGLGHALPARAAALANGTTSHALDYDDTHFCFLGHPTVAVFPAALAVAEQQQTSGRELLEAFLVGAETACRIGGYFGSRHYKAGFHQTATSGAFGAAAACARMMNLSEEQARHAFGLVATRSSGLKCQFGTMGKPFHAGMAASNGIEAATLASLGFTSRQDGIECEGGFAATHQTEGGDTSKVFAGLPDNFKFVDVQYKYHACCHGTHPTLEAILSIKATHSLRLEDVHRVTVGIPPQWFQVCCIPQPRTGLEAKFSLQLVSAMALAGVNTGALSSFSTASCDAPALVSLSRLVDIVGDETLSDTQARVNIEVKPGLSYVQEIDLSSPVALETKASKLREKAASMLGRASSQDLWDFVDGIERIGSGELPSVLRTVIDSVAGERLAHQASSPSNARSMERNMS